ncbi:MAG: HAD-IIB family hydrolase [Cyanobacteria bacterium P01_G01_bin.19]
MKYIVVTDLDGTLLDHKTYEYAPALEAIAELKRRDIPLILNSSKTQAEISAIRAELGNQEPFICENGGIICGIGDIEYLATPRQDFLELLVKIKHKLGLKYRGFSEATVEDVMEWTGLDRQSASDAMTRSATEPLMWQDSDAALNSFRQELSTINLQCVKGGRFHHVMGIFNKASCFQRLKDYYGGEEVKIVALGDSPNDLMMLEKSDYAIVIPSAKGTGLKLSHPNLYYATQHAPDGWREGISFWLANRAA